MAEFFSFGGDGEGFIKATEVIESEDIEDFMHGVDALYPPIKFLLTVFFPAVERVGPELGFAAVVIGGDTSYSSGVVIFIEFEELGVSPDIGAIERYVEWDVSNKLDIFFMSIVSEFFPLIEEYAFVEGVGCDRV